MKDEYFSLGIGLFELDWPKYIMGGHDFSNLFTSADFKDITYYIDDWDELLPVKGTGYGKKVKEVIPRLNMLGYGYNKLARQLENHVSGLPEYLKIPKVDWNKFLDLLSGLDIKKIKWLEHEGDVDPGEFLKRRILPIPQLKRMARILGGTNKDNLMIFEQIDPMIILAAVAHNSLNQDLELEWRNDKALNEGLSIDEKYLIVTEGKSDTKVLRKAIDVLYPDLADFFDFIEMNDDYPFAGAGNVANFFKGLLKVKTRRQMIFIFDNDAAGQIEVAKLKKLKYPSNFKLFILPDLVEFEEFKTKGPLGIQKENVNGRAVAIEMFLDLRFKMNCEPIIQWGQLHSGTNQLQGALCNKDNYSKLFTKLNQDEFQFYDFSKLKFLLELIVQELTS